MGYYLTKAKREEMFQAGEQKQTLHSVAMKCKVAMATVKKYRKIDNWAGRIGTIQKRVAKRVNTAAVERRMRHAKMGLLLQECGTKALAGDNERDIKAIVVDKARDAKDFIVDGVRIEREAFGDEVESLTITIKMPAGLDIGDL